MERNIKNIIYFQKERKTSDCVNNVQSIDFAADVTMGRTSCMLDRGISYKTILCSKVGIQKPEFYFFYRFFKLSGCEGNLEKLTEMLWPV